MYGQTETSPANHMTSVDDPIQKRVASVGRCAPHQEIKIVDENNRVVAIGEKGEICCRGYAVMLGYWDDEERTPTQGQAEFIVAKHRNGGLENIRLKFIGNLGKFDNLDDFDSPFEFQSQMNEGDDNPVLTKGLPSADQAFGSSLNDNPDLEEDNVVPF